MGNFYMEATQINYRRDEKLKTVDQKLQELSETSAIDTDIAPVFKSTNTYQPGDMVYYRNKLYVFNVEHTGAWAAADVTATDVTTELSSLKSGLTNYENQNNLNLDAPNRKNVLPSTLAIIKAANTNGTWVDNVYSYNGVDFTVNTNTDNYVTSIVATNAATTEGGSAIYIPMPKDNNKYLFNGGVDAEHNIIIWDVTTNARAKKWDGTTASDQSTGTDLLEASNVSDHNLTVRCRISSGVAAGSKTFYPMVCPAFITDPTFAPYIPSVESRLEALEAALAQLTNG